MIEKKKRYIIKRI